MAPVPRDGRDDAFDQLLAQQGGADATQSIPLVWAAAQLRHYAPGLYYAPQLWGTSDGCVPYRRFWAEYIVMGTHLARQRLQVGAAVTLALGGEEMASTREETRAVAFPATRGG